MSVHSIDRLDGIRNLLQRDSVVRVAELAETFGVSEMTIRRDLDVLEQEGVAQRVYGGAVALGARPFAERFSQNARSKTRIAQKLVPMVGEVGLIAMDASSTVGRLAERIQARDLTVLTNGLETFESLQPRIGVHALLTGGVRDERSGSLVGPIAERSAADVLIRRLFVSAMGIDPAVGTSEPTVAEAAVKRSMAAVSSEVVVAIDSSKLGVRSEARALDTDSIDILVTELDPDDAQLDPFREFVEIV